MGGTFSITNGGFFGSLMSTPIINMPQSAILGMHGIFQRPMAVKGEVKSYKLQVTSYKITAAHGRQGGGSCKLQATSYKLQVTSYKRPMAVKGEAAAAFGW